MFFLGGITPFATEEEEFVLKWYEADAHAEFVVTSEMAMWHDVVWFSVRKLGEQRGKMSSDDSLLLTHVLLVQDSGWLLLVNETSVIAAYKYETQEIFGLYERERFLYRTWRPGQGKVVAERRWRRPKPAD